MPQIRNIHQLVGSAIFEWLAPVPAAIACPPMALDRITLMADCIVESIEIAALLEQRITVTCKSPVAVVPGQILLLPL